MPYLSSIEQIGFEEGRKQGLEQGIEQGIEQGARQEARSLVLRLLTRRLNNLPDPIQSQIDALTLSQLELLGEALLDFTSLSDLETWLAEQNASSSDRHC